MPKILPDEFWQLTDANSVALITNRRFLSIYMGR